ncbi:MAG: ClbS/DfsB family four-helix bundle protein [Salibacteraceae bacterium]
MVGHAKGTLMSVADLVAYLLGWGALVLKWHHQKEQNEPVDFPETGYKWNELGKLAQKFYADYDHLDYPTLLSQLDAVVQQILELIHKTDNHVLYEQPWYDKWTQGKMIQLNTSSPYKNARSRVRKWKKAKGDQAG